MQEIAVKPLRSGRTGILTAATMEDDMPSPDKHVRLRSREWFDDSSDPGATALHIERYTNFGISAAELRSMSAPTRKP